MKKIISILLSVLLIIGSVAISISADSSEISYVVYDNMSTGQEVNLFEKAGFIKADILDEKALDNALKQNIDAVIHLAAKKAVGESMENPQMYSINNLTGTINILNAMVNNGVKHIVFSSSAAVYGMPEYLPLDEKHPRKPMSFYGYTKAAIEDLMQWYSELKDFIEAGL